MTGRNIFTPYGLPGMPDGGYGDGRVKLHISDEDRANIGRGHTWWATVTDLDSGRSYRVRDADCGSKGCHCAAQIVREIVDEGPSKEQKRRAYTEVIEAMSFLATTLQQLNDIYEREPWLNNVQPEQTGKVFPMSLDELALEASMLRDNWKEIDDAL
jgi:hypothetical protein